jgi:hypothetical protein
MNARQDGDRVVALVQLVERLSKGEAMVLGEIASEVFGWPIDRVYRAIDSAVRRGLIAKSQDDGAIHATAEAR